MKLKAKELRQLAVEDLRQKIVELRKDLMKNNMQTATGTTLKSPGKVKQLKKTIARIIALLNEKGLKRKEGQKKHG